MTTTAKLSADVLDSMRPALRTVYLSWEAGADLRAILPRNTFYRHRNALLPHGIDIATLVPKEVSTWCRCSRLLKRCLRQSPIGP